MVYGRITLVFLFLFSGTVVFGKKTKLPPVQKLNIPRHQKQKYREKSLQQALNDFANSLQVLKRLEQLERTVQQFNLMSRVLPKTLKAEEFQQIEYGPLPSPEISPADAKGNQGLEQPALPPIVKPGESKEDPSKTTPDQKSEEKAESKSQSVEQAAEAKKTSGMKPTAPQNETPEEAKKREVSEIKDFVSALILHIITDKIKIEKKQVDFTQKYKQFADKLDKQILRSEKVLESIELEASMLSFLFGFKWQGGDEREEKPITSEHIKLASLETILKNVGAFRNFNKTERQEQLASIALWTLIQKIAPIHEKIKTQFEEFIKNPTASKKKSFFAFAGVGDPDQKLLLEVQAAASRIIFLCPIAFTTVVSELTHALTLNNGEENFQFKLFLSKPLIGLLNAVEKTWNTQEILKKVVDLLNPIGLFYVTARDYEDAGQINSNNNEYETQKSLQILPLIQSFAKTFYTVNQRIEKEDSVKKELKQANEKEPEEVPLQLKSKKSSEAGPKNQPKAGDVSSKPQKKATPQLIQSILKKPTEQAVSSITQEAAAPSVQTKSENKIQEDSQQFLSKPDSLLTEFDDTDRENLEGEMTGFAKAYQNANEQTKKTIYDAAVRYSAHFPGSISTWMRLLKLQVEKSFYEAVAHYFRNVLVAYSKKRIIVNPTQRKVVNRRALGLTRALNQQGLREEAEALRAVVENFLENRAALRAAAELAEVVDQPITQKEKEYIKEKQPKLFAQLEDYGRILEKLEGEAVSASKKIEASSNDSKKKAISDKNGIDVAISYAKEKIAEEERKIIDLRVQLKEAERASESPLEESQASDMTKKQPDVLQKPREEEKEFIELPDDIRTTLETTIGFGPEFILDAESISSEKVQQSIDWARIRYDQLNESDQKLLMDAAIRYCARVPSELARLTNLIPFNVDRGQFYKNSANQFEKLIQISLGLPETTGQDSIVRVNGIGNQWVKALEQKGFKDEAEKIKNICLDFLWQFKYKSETEKFLTPADALISAYEENEKIDLENTIKDIQEKFGTKGYPELEEALVRYVVAFPSELKWVVTVPMFKEKRDALGSSVEAKFKAILQQFDKPEASTPALVDDRRQRINYLGNKLQENLKLRGLTDIAKQIKATQEQFLKTYTREPSVEIAVPAPVAGQKPAVMNIAGQADAFLKTPEFLLESFPEDDDVKQQTKRAFQDQVQTLVGYYKELKSPEDDIARNAILEAAVRYVAVFPTTFDVQVKALNSNQTDFIKKLVDYFAKALPQLAQNIPDDGSVIREQRIALEGRTNSLIKKLPKDQQDSIQKAKKLFFDKFKLQKGEIPAAPKPGEIQAASQDTAQPAVPNPLIAQADAFMPDQNLLLETFPDNDDEQQAKKRPLEEAVRILISGYKKLSKEDEKAKNAIAQAVSRFVAIFPGTFKAYVKDLGITPDEFGGLVVDSFESLAAKLPSLPSESGPENDEKRSIFAGRVNLLQKQLTDQKKKDRVDAVKNRILPSSQASVSFEALD